MKRFLAFLLLALFVLGMGLLFTNCGARKKSVIENKTEIVKEETTSSQAAASGSTDTRVATVEKAVKSEVKKETTVIVQDGQEMTIEEYDELGVLKGMKIFKGSGKATVSESAIDQAFAKEQQTTQNSEFNNSEQNNSTTTTTTKSENSEMNLDRKESFTWPFLWIIAIAIAAYVIYDLNKRRV